MTRPVDLFTAAAGISFCLATSFLYYVTFVQFGFMHHLQTELALPQQQIFMALGLMLVCGIVGGIIGGFWVDHSGASIKPMYAGIGGLSIAAFGLALGAYELTSTWTVMVFMAALGLVLGLLIVLLLSAFTKIVNMRIRGMFAGFACAACYFAANVIVAIVDNPRTICTINAFAIFANPIVLALIWETSSEIPTEPLGKASGSSKSFLLALLPLAVLVFIDTYTFYPVGQENFGPNPIFAEAFDWHTNGIYHLLFALVGGLMYFTIGRRRLLQVGFILMFIAAGLLIGNHWHPLKGVILAIYSLLVVIYTIVFFTIWGETLPSKNPGLWLGIGLALCGWCGSSFGIGASMGVASTLPLPYPFIITAVLALAGFALISLTTKKTGQE